MDCMLQVAEDAYARSAAPIAGRALVQHWPRLGEVGFPEATLLGISTPAHVNHGRWLAACPFCISAQVTSPNDPRFFCVECENAGTRSWVTVDWPEDVAEIEKALYVRPLEAQSWNPDETVEDLRAENNEYAQELLEHAHGLSHPKPGTFGVTDDQRLAIERARAQMIERSGRELPPGRLLAGTAHEVD